MIVATELPVKVAATFEPIVEFVLYVVVLVCLAAALNEAFGILDRIERHFERFETTDREG